jgi:hypothetical protein
MNVATFWDIKMYSPGHTVLYPRRRQHSIISKPTSDVIINSAFYNDGQSMNTTKCDQDSTNAISKYNYLAYSCTVTITGTFPHPTPSNFSNIVLQFSNQDFIARTISLIRSAEQIFWRNYTDSDYCK